MVTYPLLAVCIAVVIALLGYTFYWNRCLAFVISFILRLLYWKQGSESIWVELGSIQFQILAGRVLIKNLCYHSSSQTIKIVRCTINWRYWIRRPTDEDDLNRMRVGGEDVDHKASSWPLSCRIHVSMDGFEWFLYNKMSAYDDIISRMQADEDDLPAQPRKSGFSTDGPSLNLREATSNTTAYPDSSLASRLYPPSQPSLPLSSRLPRFVYVWAAWINSQLPSLDPKDLLPASFQVVKGAILCGNPSTPNLLMAQFGRADGTFGIVTARSPYDLYKQMLSIKFRNPSISYVENTDYNASMLATGQLAHERMHQHRPLSTISPSLYLSFPYFARLWYRLRLQSITSKLSSSSLHTSTHAHEKLPHTTRPARSMSIDDPTPIGADFSKLEYAIERTLLEAPLLELSYYADVAGIVPSNPRRPGSEGLEPFDIGNGDLLPEWGIDLVVHGGFLRYGPWADRQRAEMQRTFFPSAFHDIAPAYYLKPGDERRFTYMKVFIELRNDTTLQIPFREASKNWQWDGQVHIPRPRKREGGYLHIKTGDNSTISYIVPMIATENGYDSICVVHLDTITITSSLNDIPLLSAETCRVVCEMPSPLQWRAERQWTFDVVFRKPTMYLIRDHVNMLTDLGKDWSSGPPAVYNRFIPMLYVVKLDFDDFMLNLYTNDHNIIDRPLVKEDNAMLTLHAARLRTEVRIPSTSYRPQSSTISFWLDIPDVSLSLTLPRWNTHSLYATRRLTDIGRIAAVRIDASFLYFSEVRDEHVDQLKLTILAQKLAFKSFGWVIRHFMNLRENYLGTFTNFSTLNEYLEKRRNGFPPGDPVELRYRKGKSNVFQTELQIEVEHATVMMPAEILGFEAITSNQDEEHNTGRPIMCLMCTIPLLQLHLRLHDYYMETSLNIHTIQGNVEDDCQDEILFGESGYHPNREMILVDGLNITANRLFGPQPRTSTYLCIWEIHLGDVKAVLSAPEGRLVLAAVNAFRLNFADPFNAPASEYMPPLDRDVTFMKVLMKSLNLTWLAGVAAVNLSMNKGLIMDSNDLAGKSHRKVTSIKVPVIAVKLLHSSISTKDSWVEAASMSMDLNLDLYSCPHNLLEIAHSQATFVASQDILTHRTSFLFDHDGFPSRITRSRVNKSTIYLPHPALPGSHRGMSSMSHALFNASQVGSRRPIPTMNEDSESEGEQGISEADRDARLARSRPASPSVMNTASNDQNLSSDDESDDGDDTEGDAWNDNWSDLDDDFYETHPNWPRLSHYAEFMKQYTASCLNRPSLWERSPFLLAKDPQHSLPDTGEDSDSAAGFTHPIFSDHVPSHGKGDSKLDCSFVRFSCHQAIEIVATPIVVGAIGVLLEDMNPSWIYPELRLDTMLANHIGAIPSLETAQRCKFVDFHVPAVWLRFMQGIPMLDPSDSSISNSGDPIAHLSQQPGAVVALDLVLSDWSASGKFVDSTPLPSSTQRFWTLNTALHRISFVFSALGSKEMAHRSQTFSKNTFYQLSVTRTDAQFSNGAFQLSLGLICPTLRISVLEHAMGMVAMTMDQVAELTRIFSRHKHQSIAATQHTIRLLLELSQKKTILDPLSLIQPSYLVQSGRPHDLRMDVTYKLLFHLRNSLRYLDTGEREALLDLQPNLDSAVSVGDIILLLEPQWPIFNADANLSGLADLPLLRELFHVPVKGNRLASSPSSALYGIWSLIIRGQGIRIVQRHDEEQTHNQLLLGPFLVSICMRHRELLHVVPLTLGKNPPATVSYLRDKVNLPYLQNVGITVSLDEIQIIIYPHLISFIQRILRIQRQYARYLPQNTDSSVPSISKRQSRPWDVEVLVSIRNLRTQAAAQNLVLEFGTTSFSSSARVCAKASSSLTQQWDLSANVSFAFEDISLKARTTLEGAKGRDQDVLASVVLSNGKFHAIFRREPSHPILLSATSDTKQLHVSVPRSAIRLYRFVEEWRADYLPGFEDTFRSLLSEIERKPRALQRVSRSRRSSHGTFVFQLQASLMSFGVSLQVMHGTWLEWEILDTISYARTDPHHVSRVFGVQLASQTLSISSTSVTSRSVVPTSSVKLELPTIRTVGEYDGKRIHTRMLIDFFHLAVKPSDWDALLSVQQKFGQDFNDLLLLVEETRRTRQTPVVSKVNNIQWAYDGVLKLRGFRIGLEGPLTTMMYLECEDINGAMDNDEMGIWNITVSDLALSLAPRADGPTRDSSPNIKHRSAFVIIDFEANNSRAILSTSSPKSLAVAVSKINAVMQPSSIGEVGDFIDHIQGEMMIRKEHRALELAEFKRKTKSVLRTFDVSIRRSTHFTEKHSWLKGRTVSLTIRNIGVAFPLTLDGELELPHSGSQDSSTVKAFLFSIKAMDFRTQSGEYGQASMRNFSFQFISSFRQSVPSDFNGDSHQTRNRLCYPQMDARLRSEPSSTTREIRVDANVSGFILDLDSSIPDFVFSLIDVYRHGKERVDRLSVSIPRNPFQTDALQHVPELSVDSSLASLRPLGMRVSMIFQSGKVRFHSGATSTLPRTQSLPLAMYDMMDDVPSEFDVEIFSLPVVSVWTEYRASSLVSDLSRTGSSVLIFKSTIHSSHNMLKPVLLPFFTEVIDKVERRMRRSTWRTSRPSSLAIHETLPPSSSEQESQAAFAATSMRISFSLRIDQSRLEFTCQPDVNVIAGLHWKSGGFVVNISPGAQRVSFTGSVGGLSIGLKHGFLSEDCVKLDARNLAFSVTFSKVELEPGEMVNTVSLIVDTEISGGVRFSRLQDVLCFKAVWLDHIPIFNAQNLAISGPSGASGRPGITPTKESAALQAFTTALLIRVRQIKVEADLGQSISSVTLDFDEVLVRTRLTQAFSEVSLSVAKVAVLAVGNIAGHLKVPDFVFQTIRRREDQQVNGSSSGSNKMLELSMTSGSLDILLESEYQRLLQYRAEPLQVTVFDDWSAFTPRLHSDDRRLRLSFTITGSEITVVATVGTIPKLVSYAKKFTSMLETQREGASRESKTFRVTRTPKPDNPLSDVATAMIQAARNRLKEVETGFLCVIRQHMSLRLGLLRLVVFPRSMSDVEIARFVGYDVEAQLDRVVDSDGRVAKRDLHLSFSSMTIAKCTQLNHAIATSNSSSDAREWLSLLLKGAVEAVIFGLPSMDMRMVSEEEMGQEVGRVLVYDFKSNFVRREGDEDSEDIYISLNISLYSWLTILRKTFAREMDQVQALSDWRLGQGVGSASPAAAGGATPRRKAPEAMSVSISRDSSDPSPASRPTTPSPISSAHNHNLEQIGSSPAQSSSAIASHKDSSAVALGPSAIVLPPTNRSDQDVTAGPGPGSGPAVKVGGANTPTAATKKKAGLIYSARDRHIERLTMRQLGEATPDVMHPFFMKTAGFNLEDSLPQYVHEYATIPIEEIMKALLELYSKQLRVGKRKSGGTQGP